jgi:hypothetical protein
MTDLAQMERKLHGYQVVLWLKQTYRVAEDEGDDNTAPAYWSKNSVYKAYIDMCHTNGYVTMFTRPVVGKMVKRAFPDIRTKRRGRRGNVKQHYIGLHPIQKGNQQIPRTSPAPVQASPPPCVSTLETKVAEEYCWPSSAYSDNATLSDQCPTPGMSGSGEWSPYPTHHTPSFAPPSSPLPAFSYNSSFSSSSAYGADSSLRAPYHSSTLHTSMAAHGCVGVNSLESLESQWDWAGRNSIVAAQPKRGEEERAENQRTIIEEGEEGRLSLAEELAWKRWAEGDDEDISSLLVWVDQVVDTHPWPAPGADLVS